MATTNITEKLCVPEIGIGSRGLWIHGNPLNHPYPLMMAQIVLVVITTHLLYCLMRPLGQTKFVCSALAGIIFGPSVIGNNKAFRDTMYGPKMQFPLFDTVAKIGTAYAIFLCAVKIDLTILKRTAKNSWKIALASFLCPTVVFFGAVYPVAHTPPGMKGGVYLFMTTCALSFSYFPVLVQALSELNLMTSELGQLALSSALFNDATQLSIATTHLLLSQETVLNGFGAFLSFLALLMFIIYVFRPILLFIDKKTPEGTDIHEGYVLALQLWVLLSSFLSDFIGMRHTSGAIMLGLAIPHGTRIGAAIIAKSEFLVNEFLLPMFFFRVGISIDVHSITDWKSFGQFQVILLVLYVSKIVGVTVAGLFAKLNFKNSIVISMMMNVKGILDLIIYSRLKAMKLIDDQRFTQLVLSMLGITMLVTPIIRFQYVLQLGRGSSGSDPLFRLNIQSMPFKTELFRMICCVHNEESVHNIITFLEASNPTEASMITAYVVHAMEFIGRSVPLLVPYKNRSSDNPTHKMIQAFENYSQNSKGSVVIKPYTMVAPYKTMHESVSRLAQEKLISLIIIPFHENHQAIVGSNVTGSIRQFNINVQAFSPCTVGILVDRGFSHRMTSSKFTCNVVLFFIGGPDDREALAYASRIADNPAVGITVFRIIMRINSTESKEDVEAEFKLDESLIDEFKLRNLGNGRLKWHEIEVDDGAEVMSTINNSQGQYDLAIVGRRHSNIATLSDEEMADFVQYPELGVIGDMLASSDFCGGSVNVLVMQESRELGVGAFRFDSGQLSRK